MAGERIAALRTAMSPTTVARISIAVVLVSLFLTWASYGPVTLNGVQAPNNGWLAAIVCSIALVWTRSLARGSWISIVGVLGAAAVTGWTAIENWIENRDTLSASASYGLVLVVVGSVGLAGAAVMAGLRRPARSGEPPPSKP